MLMFCGSRGHPFILILLCWNLVILFLFLLCFVLPGLRFLEFFSSITHFVFCVHHSTSGLLKGFKQSSFVSSATSFGNCCPNSFQFFFWVQNGSSLLDNDASAVDFKPFHCSDVLKTIEKSKEIASKQLN